MEVRQAFIHLFSKALFWKSWRKPLLAVVTNKAIHYNELHVNICEYFEYLSMLSEHNGGKIV